MEDNSACIRFSEKPQSATSLKFLELDIIWINDLVRDRLQLLKVIKERKIPANPEVIVILSENMCPEPEQNRPTHPKDLQISCRIICKFSVADL